MEEKFLGLELRRLSLLISRYMESHTNCKKVKELTGSNGWIIGYIGRINDGDVFQRDLEKTFGITRSTASKTVDTMVEKGFIERQSVDYDARLKKLVLTEKARNVLEIMDEDKARIEGTLTKGFSDEDKEKLCEYLSRMTRNIEACSEEKL